LAFALTRWWVCSIQPSSLHHQQKSNSILKKISLHSLLNFTPPTFIFMEATTKIPRRDFIKISALSGTALMLGCLSTSGKDPLIQNLSMIGDGQGTEVNQYIFINTSGEVTLYNHRPEMGQGTFTSIPMILAEELEVDMAKVIIKQSPANRQKYGDQMVVGSRSIQSNFELMRKMGASAKEMLVQAAAKKWNVSVSECFAEMGSVINIKTKSKFHYGELVEEASQLTPPEKPTLKNPKDFKIIGQSIKRGDIAVKVNGQAKFGMDFSVPGMLYASIERSPVFLGKIKSFDSSNALKVPGVKHVLKTSREVYVQVREGVAVIADTYWAATQGRKALIVNWDNGDLESWSTKKIKEDYVAASKGMGNVLFERGDAKKLLDGGGGIVEAAYETPYQSHATMEPMNCLVSVEKDSCEFWGSTQNPNGVRSFLAKKYGLAEENVIIHYTFMGGGFGRRSMTDVAEEAADLSKQTGAPIKVIWTRDDDTTQGPFRACSLNVCKGKLDENGKLIALEHKIICQDIRNQTGNDTKATTGIMGGVNTEYAVPNFSVNGVLRKLPIPISYWRAVYHSTNCFGHESFMDEMAQAAKKNPIDFRLEMLKEHRRYTQVLQTVAEKSDWYSPRKKDTGKGVSIVERSGAFVALVIEVQRIKGKVKPTKITAAIDCGICVNPETVKAQTEGSIVMGLTATYKSAITIDKGRAVEKNFDTYKMLGLEECPEIEVHVIKSTDPPEGAGESGLANVAPSLTNAIFDLMKKRIRVIPFNLDEV
jgi:isoquinoline 1-oxidoreductase subunit beta